MATATRFEHIDIRPGAQEAKMSLIGDTAYNDPDTDIHPEADGSNVGARHAFRFVPNELAAKWRKLADSYHGIYGYAGLPDMLWLSDARDIIECHRDLEQIFKKASKLRGAKRANESFLLIATVVLTLEVLARDYAGWGKRFPTAKREAEKLLGELRVGQRAWLMDMYLYPSLGVRHEFANALALSATGAQASARN
jgi:hypothetical protein